MSVERKKPSNLVGFVYLLFVLGSTYIFWMVPIMYHEIYGNVVWLFCLLLTSCVFAGDLIISSAFYENYETLILNGYSPTYIWFCVVFMIFTGLSPVTLVVLMFPNLKSTFELWSLSSWICVIINLIVGELFFFNAHRWMHLYRPSWHMFHHCATRSSYTTNFLFSPMDSLVEFGGPFTVVLINHWLFQDVSGTVLSIVIIALWYGLDHDEFLNLPHVKHHAYIDRVYTIYVKYRDKNHNDLIRKNVKRLEQKNR